METLQLDSVGASFVNMVMDRLHALEERHMQEVAELKRQNSRLASKVQDLEGSVFLLDDLRTFSNGSMLEPGFAMFPDMLNKCIAGRMQRSEKDMGIDDMHLDAVAVHGKIGLDIEMYAENLDDEGQLVDADDTLFVVGEHGKSTSVRQLLAAWNAHCAQLRKDNRMPMVDITSYQGFDMFGHDEKQNVPVYCLRLHVE